MTEALILMSPAASDSATVAASSEASGLPATNLQTVQPRKKWRSTGTSAEYLLVTFAAGVACDCLALVGHNLGASATVRIRGANSGAAVTAAPVYDSGVVSAWPTSGKPSVTSWSQHTLLKKWSNSTALTNWRIDLADSAPVTTYLEAGRLALGDCWQPSIGFDVGGTPLGFEAADVQTRSAYGGLFTERRSASPPRTFDLAIYALSKREAFDGIYEIQRLRGLWGDVICCLDPSETADLHRFTMQGAFTAGGAYTLPPSFDDAGNMFGAGIKLREFI